MRNVTKINFLPFFRNMVKAKKYCQTVHRTKELGRPTNTKVADFGSALKVKSTKGISIRARYVELLFATCQI